MTGLARLNKMSDELKREGGSHEEGEVLAAQIESLLATGMPSVTSLTGEVARPPLSP